jgi:3-hydroxyisobutyrate dehydrogenase-like beta-hydroxyacid dehydrogenase
MTTRRIGFIGAGLMGHGAAKNILEGGYPLGVLAHRNRAPIEDLVGRGAIEARSAQELAATSDLLFTCVSNSAVVETVVLGEAGVLEGAHPGLVIVDMTTALPASTRKLATALAAKGARLVDGPVTLTPKEAEAGRLNIMIGAEAALLDEIRPVLECFCQRIFHTGPLGSAHTLKLINNFLTMGNTALVMEALATALKAGVEPKMMVDLISVSGGDSEAFQRFGRLLTGEGDPDLVAFSVANAKKDVSYFWQLAESEAAYTPLADTVRRWYDLALALGYGERLMPALFELQGRLNGVEISLPQQRKEDG